MFWKYFMFCPGLYDDQILHHLAILSVNGLSAGKVVSAYHLFLDLLPQEGPVNWSVAG
jgi:hypothetical protein